MNYKDICASAKNIVLETGKFIKKQSELKKEENIEIEIKGLNDFVTEVDKKAEKMLVDKLAELLPESGFIVEENTKNNEGEKYNWIIDPLDGTTNFIHGLPPFAISVALVENKEVVAGIVYEIMQDECFYSWKGAETAYLNNKEMQVSDTKKVNDSLIITGFPYRDFGRMDNFMESLNYLMRNTHGVRRLGSAATDLAYIACGRSEAFYEYGLKPWDVAAGAFLVKQAGGKVSDFKLGDNYVFGKEIIASNKFVFDEFSTLINSLLNGNINVNRE